MLRWRPLRLVILTTSLSVMVPAGAMAANTLRVMPFPNTPDASPHSEIIFSTLKPSDLGSVWVLGTTSGGHKGRLISLPNHAGTAYLARRPFTPGETVGVVASLRTRSAAKLAGNGDSKTLKWTFRVTVAGPTQAASDRESGPLATSADSDTLTQAFRSRPDLHPPLVSLTQDRDRDAGDIFLTANHNPQPGPLILDPRGRLVWFASRGAPAYNLQVQSYQGRPVLTWWEGAWLGVGRDVIMSQSYRRVAEVHAGEGYQDDLHEFQITPQGTALVDIYQPVRADLRSLGGPANGSAMDCIIQELDIKTGRVLWEWHALGHVPLSASYAAVPTDTSAFDYFHINSIQQLSNGNLLISSRSDWALYEISKRTGDVIWTLGGKRSSFKMEPGTNFEWQHDAHLNPDGTLSLYDDAGSPQEESESSGKVLSINTRRMTVSLVHRYAHSPHLLSSLAGSVQTLPDRDVVVGWGSEPVFSQYTPSGRLVFDGRFPYGVYSYRVYRFPWTGHPLTRPALAVWPGSGGGTVLYASWNGDTQVAYWRALAGASPRTLHPLGRRVAWSGFETTIRLAARPQYLAVQALDGAGRVLSTSAARTVPSGG